MNAVLTPSSSQMLDYTVRARLKCWMPDGDESETVEIMSCVIMVIAFGCLLLGYLGPAVVVLLVFVFVYSLVWCLLCPVDRVAQFSILVSNARRTHRPPV